VYQKGFRFMMNSRRIPIFLLTLVMLLSMVAAAFPGGASSQASPTKTATATKDTHVPTIQAQQTTIAELKGTVTARGKKINAQRTQIAELKTEVATYKPVVPTSTPTPDLAEPYLTQLVEDLAIIQGQMGIFDTEIAKGRNADATKVFRALDSWINTYNTYAGTIAPAGYEDLHKDWLYALGYLNDSATVFYAYLYGSGDDFAMQAAMVDYMTISRYIRSDLGPRIRAAAK
jgi:hypothetical protein